MTLRMLGLKNFTLGELKILAYVILLLMVSIVSLSKCLLQTPLKRAIFTLFLLLF